MNRWVPKVGEMVNIRAHFGSMSGPYAVKSITPSGAIRVTYNDKASGLFKWNESFKEYVKAHRGRVTMYSTLIHRNK